MTATEAHSPASRRPLVLRIVSRMAIGGVQNGIVEVLSRVDRSRFDLAVLCTKKEGAWAERLRAIGVPVYTQKTLPPWDPYQIWRLSRVIRRLRPDLVHVHMAPLVIPGVMAARLAGVKRVIVQHHSDYTNFWAGQNAFLRRWEWALTRRAQALLAVSGPAARATCAHLGLPPERVEVLPNGVDCTRFTPRREGPDPREAWGLAPGRPLVFMVSRYLESKRIEDFIDAAAVITGRWEASRGEGPAFVVIGGGPQPLRDQYQTRIDALGGRVKIWLEGSRYDLPQLLPWADVAALPTENEGCPNTILEYLAAGRPMVSTTIEPVAELVEHGREGLLCAPRDVAAMTENIERLLTDRELAARLGQAAAARAQRYDWRRTAAAYQAVYERVLAGGR